MIRTHLLPEVRLQGKTRASGNKPAVPHDTLVQVVRADALHEQMGVITDLLQQKGSRDVTRFDCKKYKKLK